MAKKGITLIELSIAMTIGGIMVLAMVCQFVAEQRIRAAVNDKISAVNDASIVMHNMTRVLRYAKPDTVATADDWKRYSKSVSATIEQGHLSDIITDTPVGFGRIGHDDIPAGDVTDDYPNNSFLYDKAGTFTCVADDITDFDVIWSQAANKLTIKVTARKNGKSCSLQTTITPLGG